jgi:hypothetical protein
MISFSFERRPRMRTTMALVSVLALSMVFPPIVGADALKGKMYFIGLWQGVDPMDGSEALRSITLKDDGTFKIIGSETYWTICDGGRGIVEGTGVLNKGILAADHRITCFTGVEGITETTAQFIPDKKNGILEEIHEDGSPSLILHRIDTRN